MKFFPWLVLTCLTGNLLAGDPFNFSEGDRRFLSQLSLNALEPLELHDYGAEISHPKAASLGRMLFFDRQLSGNGAIACSSCHVPENYFTDHKPQGEGIGQTSRNTPSVLLAKYSPWQTWDGRKDSLWSQALEPLESPLEHGSTRQQVVEVVRSHYLELYTEIFGTIDDSKAGIDQAFANVGKAIMAYQFQLEVKPSRFDRFVDAAVSQDKQAMKEIFSRDEVLGLRLFVGKANCISCHNGPLFTNFEFHNTGVPPRNKAHVDLGRYQGVKKLVVDEFTCLSSFSGLDPESCLEMKFLKTTGPELVGAFKTPSLRNIAKTAPYMHAGQFDSLEAVLDHYSKPTPPFYDRQQHPNRPHFDIMPLNLSLEEKKQIVAFLLTLTSPFSGV